MTMPRETGSEKSEASCPNCGGAVGVNESAYGSTSPAPCPKCYPATEKAGASSPSAPPRELGSDVAANAGSQEGES